MTPSNRFYQSLPLLVYQLLELEYKYDSNRFTLYMEVLSSNWRIFPYIYRRFSSMHALFRPINIAFTLLCIINCYQICRCSMHWPCVRKEDVFNCQKVTYQNNLIHRWVLLYCRLTVIPIPMDQTSPELKFGEVKNLANIQTNIDDKILIFVI